MTISRTLRSYRRVLLIQRLFRVLGGQRLDIREQALERPLHKNL